MRNVWWKLNLQKNALFSGVDGCQLKGFCSLIDDDGVISIGTKVSERNDFLPSKHHVASKLIYEYHLKILACRNSGIIESTARDFGSSEDGDL